ncbi:hypothetical protein BZA77DRAFT_347022 [Pyronema omphalodes]|nr:hypothetical protein BZA77DRAFT_347022 [Pyronema omphalodes]
MESRTQTSLEASEVPHLRLEPPSSTELVRSDSNTSTVVGSTVGERWKNQSMSSAASNSTLAIPPTIYTVAKQDNSDIDVEKQEQSIDDWTEIATQELAQKRHGSIFRNIRYRIMSMYRRLFTVIFLINLIIAICLADKKMGTIDRIANACLGNLAAAVLIRQENFINYLFRGFASVPTSWPLWIRRHCAKIYALGGIHSGCALFSVIWLVWLTGSITKNFIHEHMISKWTLALDWAILILLIMQTASAYPIFRAKFHNNFEMTHRFAGWASVILVWGLIVSLLHDLHPEMPLGRVLVVTPAFWFLVVITICIIYPWLHLRKLAVETVVLSSHVCRIYIKDRSYVKPYPGSFVRLSSRPLFEWHSFAAIAEPGCRQGDYSVVVSKAGDWTSHIIANPPKEMWFRGVPTCGVLHVAKLFRKIVLIGTGSGIGPCLAVLKAREVEARVLWSTRSPRKTFGDTVVEDVLAADPKAVIYDTVKGGRPDIVKMAYSMYIDSEAEAVIIISNPKLTYQVVYGLESRGVPAFGAIWDS